MPKKLFALVLAVAMSFSLLSININSEAKGSSCKTTNYWTDTIVKESSKGPDIFMNDEKVTFSKDYGYPFIDKSNRTQVPFRAFSEACNFDVSWDGDARIGYASKGNMTVGIPVGKNYITVNGKVVESDTENIIINGRIHLPLRIVLESFDYQVKWDGENGCIYVANDNDGSVDQGEGSDIPADSTKDNDVPNESNDTQDNSVESSEDALRGIHIGENVSQLISELGQPNRTDVSGQGFDWYIYNQDYSQYLQVGVKAGKVVALYTNASYWELTSTIQYGAEKNTVMEQLQAKYDYSNHLTATKGNINYRFYVDQYDSNKVVAVLIMDNSMEANNHSVESSPALVSSYEKEIFDLTNVERVNKGLQPYQWDEELAAVARNHSKDMINNSYFSHTNKQGQAPWDRAKAAGVSYSYFSENIAYGQRNAMDVVNAWMNSSGHRKNILNEVCTDIGVGVQFKSDSTPYYTQNFIKK